MVKTDADWDRERDEQKLKDLDEKLAELNDQNRHGGGFKRERDALAERLGK